MRGLRAWFMRLFGLVDKTKQEWELSEEFKSHLQLQTDENVRRGMTSEEAHRQASIASGGIESAKESYRDRRGLPAIETLALDIRYAARMLRKSPGFTVVAVLTLALGIGFNSAIFTVVNSVLIEPPPFRDSGKLVVVWETNALQGDHKNVVSPANYLRWNERASAFEQMAAFYEWRANLTGDAEPEEVIAQDVTSNFFSTLGVAPMLGRGFAADEGPDGHDDVTVLSYALWQRRFGGDASIVGRPIRLNGHPLTVIGVMPPDVSLFIKAGSLVGKPAELWTPFAFTDAMRVPRGRYLSAIGRLKLDVSVTQARTQMDTIAAGLTTEFPQFDTGWNVRLVSLQDELSGEIRPALLVLSGAVAFVLLLACANVANLLLARGASRRREIAIRTALGGARSRVLRQLLTENLLLALLGGTVGIVVARWSVRLLLAISPIDITRLGHVQLNGTVLGFTIVISFLTAVICGWVPAMDSARVDMHESLKDGARTGSSVRHRWLQKVFVVAQIAIAVVLLAGAGLMVRSFGKLRGIAPGFESHNVLTMRVTLPNAGYGDSSKIIGFFQNAIERIRALPGVRAAGEVSYLPLTGNGAATDFTVVGQPPPEVGKAPVVDVRICDNGYFESMGVPLIKGRLFAEREMQEISDVVIINETMARLNFPGEDPIGKRLLIEMGSVSNPPAPTEIIGVVGDVKHVDLTTEPRAMAYWPHPRIAMSAMTLTIRTNSDPMAEAPLVERTIQSIDRNQPVSDVRTMEQWISVSLAQTSFSSTLLALFGGLALLLAAIGIYGVMSYSVTQQTSEIAVRIALGADSRAILRMVVGSGIRLVLAGLAVGLPLALLLNRTLTTLLYKTTSFDPIVFSIAVSVLGAVAILASYLPARRAAHVMPVEALRSQ